MKTKLLLWILAVAAVVIGVIGLMAWNLAEVDPQPRDHARAISEPTHEEPRGVAVNAGPIDARIDAQVRPTSPVPQNLPPSAGPANMSGRALTVTFPTSDEVEVFRDNQWVRARIVQREPQRVYVRYESRGGSQDEWVTADRVR